MKQLFCSAAVLIAMASFAKADEHPPGAAQQTGATPAEHPKGPAAQAAPAAEHPEGQAAQAATEAERPNGPAIQAAQEQPKDAVSTTATPDRPTAHEEHPEHPMGAKAQAPVGSKAWIRQMRKEYDEKVCEVAKAKSKEPYVIHDDKLNKDWQLKLIKVHKDRIVSLDAEGKRLFACSDFKSVKKGDPGKVDLDFYAVKNPDGSLTIDKTLIHKVNGEPRYTYNDKNEMVPVK